MNAPGDGAIRARGLAKAFAGGPVLDGVDLDVPAGRVVALLGPNGAGKSTLIRILSTLVIPDAGHATVAGIDVVADPRSARRGLGLVVGDERSWYWRLSARDNLVFFGVLNGLDRRDAATRGTWLMEAFGLHDVGRQRVGTFSAGMRGRLGLARALLADPPVLILDEPTRSIDPIGSEEFRARVRALAGDDGKAVLLATHDLEEAATTADEVVVLVHGRVGAREPGGSVDRIRTAVRAAADG